MEKQTNSSTKFRKFKRSWIMRDMGEIENREQFLERTLREMVFYLIFLLLITILAIGMVFPSMYYLTKVIKEEFIEKLFHTIGYSEITFHGIRTASDFWTYTETALLDVLYWDHMYKPGNESEKYGKKILYENKLIGVPRFRQLKVRNDSCTIHNYFQRMFLSCYDGFSTSSEDTQPFGLANSSAWIYNSAETTQSVSYWGNIASYHGGGYYQDLALNRSTSKQIIHSLKTNFWITRGTRCIFIDFTVYNANLNLFCFVKLAFEFPPTGGILTSSEFKTAKLIRYVSSFDYFVLVCEVIVIGFIIYYTVDEVREVAHNKLNYLKHFWNYIDLIILLLTYCCIIMGIIRTVAVKNVFKKNLHMTTDEYANFEYVSLLVNTYNTLIAILLFLAYIKLFKDLSFNKTMGQLNDTLHKCALDILGFSVMFFIIFFAYAELGYLLFGTQVMGFSSFGIAMFTLLRTILGDFDYTEIETANRLLAPIYFLTYIFLVFFVLLNMFLAIINDTYCDVKTEISMTPSELQMSEFVRRGIYNLIEKWGFQKWLPSKKKSHNEIDTAINQIRTALKRCGFTDIEIEMFFARYNIDATARVGEFDINKLMLDLESTEISVTKDYMGNTSKEKRSSSPLVDNDFIMQQERLSEIEKVIAQLTNKVDAILKKLDLLDNVRKVPVKK